MGFAAQNGLVEMGDAPALRDVESKQPRQFFGRLFRHGVAPGTKAGQLLTLFIKDQITVHHGRYPDGGQIGEGNAVPIGHIVAQTAIALLQALPHILQRIGPHAVLQAVLPTITARS